MADRLVTINKESVADRFVTVYMRLCLMRKSLIKSPCHKASKAK